LCSRPFLVLHILGLATGHNNSITPAASATTRTSAKVKFTTRQCTFVTFTPLQTRATAYSSIASPTTVSTLRPTNTAISTTRKMSSTTTEDFIQRKKVLRKEIRSRVKKLTQEQISTQSKSVWNHLFTLPEYQNASSVGLFCSMPKGEIETDVACTQVLKDGKILYVPRVGLDFEKCDMDLVKVVPKEKEEEEQLFHHDWPRNKWGIPEPPTDVEHETAGPGDIDLLVVPGLAFDVYGGRLGQGKGYYDRFIAKINPRTDDDKKTLLVAVGLKPQFLDGDNDGVVPMAKYDFFMDKVVLHDGVVTLSKK